MAIAVSDDANEWQRVPSNVHILVCLITSSASLPTELDLLELCGTAEIENPSREETVQLHSPLVAHASLQDQAFLPPLESCSPTSPPASQKDLSALRTELLNVQSIGPQKLFVPP